MLRLIPLGRRRLGVSAVVPRGALTAGQGQWLGVAVSPLHDVLRGAQLRLSLAQHGSPMYGGATGYAGVMQTPPNLVRLSTDPGMFCSAADMSVARQICEATRNPMPFLTASSPFAYAGLTPAQGRSRRGPGHQASLMVC